MGDNLGNYSSNNSANNFAEKYDDDDDDDEALPAADLYHTATPTASMLTAEKRSFAATFEHSDDDDEVGNLLEDSY